MKNDRRPHYARTGAPVELEQPGYYPGYSTLSQKAYWDATTREKVLNRVNKVPPIRFFNADQAATMQAIIDRMLPQDDRPPARRIPILNTIDDRLHTGRIDGYRYENMPPDREAHLLGMEAIDRAAQKLHGKRFRELDQHSQDAILKCLHDGKPPVEDEVWQRMPIKHFWMLLLQDCVEGYYAHPWAWDEIGYGGPAYPRGYMRLEGGKPEPWEKDELRYEWKAPEGSLSDEYGALGSKHAEHFMSGQEGTH